MKVLLVGEYSGVHKNLKEGLLELGHQAIVSSRGDSWKKVESDISWASNKRNPYANTAEIVIRLVANLPKMRRFDVVQFINPYLIPIYVSLNRKIISYLIRNNQKSFLLAAGCDTVFWDNIRKTDLEYHPCEGCIKDYNMRTCMFDDEKLRQWTYEMIELVDGVIPTSYSYDLVYQAFRKKREMIPLPVNTKKIQFMDNHVSSKIVFLHGINRRWFKGSNYIEQAMQHVKAKYPNDVELITVERLPLAEYLEVLKKANVVVDQTFGYALGMNSLFSMALGKVVMSRYEDKFFSHVKDFPVINIKPDVSVIIERLEYLIENRRRIPEFGYISRKYVEDNHDYLGVAGQFIATWQS